MKALAALAIGLFLCGSARAENELVKGGKSPDGHFEVRIYNSPGREPSDYYFALVDSNTGKPIKELPTSGGINKYRTAAETASALWHSSSRCFAITDRGTKHSRELFVFEVRDNEIEALELPDFFRSAVGLVNATEGYAVSVVTPLRWEADDLVCGFVFDATLPKAGRSPQYTTEFTLRLYYGANQRSYLRLESMNRPEPHEG
jgi:hypothetical protein